MRRSPGASSGGGDFFVGFRPVESRGSEGLFQAVRPLARLRRVHLGVAPPSAHRRGFGGGHFLLRQPTRSSAWLGPIGRRVALCDDQGGSAPGDRP